MAVLLHECQLRWPQGRSLRPSRSEKRQPVSKRTPAWTPTWRRLCHLGRPGEARCSLLRPPSHPARALRLGRARQGRRGSPVFQDLGDKKAKGPLPRTPASTTDRPASGATPPGPARARSGPGCFRESSGKGWAEGAPLRPRPTPTPALGKRAGQDTHRAQWGVGGARGRYHPGIRDGRRQPRDSSLC